MDVQFVKSKRGQDLLLVNNFKFRTKNKKNDRIYWSCSVKGCPSRCVTRQQEQQEDVPVVKGPSPHNGHAPLSHTTVKSLHAVEEMKQRVVEWPQIPLQRIYNEVVQEIIPDDPAQAEDLASSLPVYNSCRMSLHRVRKRGLPAQVCQFHQSAVKRWPAHDAEFNAAKERLNTLTEEPDNMVKLKIYALFKQATVGQCNTAKPGAFDFVGKAKWDAWKGLGGMSQDDAQKEYINLINGLAGAEASTSEPAGPEDRFDGMKVTKQNKVFRIQLNRPTKKNALTWQMYRDITKVLGEAAEDKDVSVAVLTGTGDYYCSGNDLSNFTNVKPEDIPQMALDGRDVLKAFVSAFIDFPKPLIALVNGPAVGVAVTVLGLFDAVYCTDRATFHTPFSQLGQSPEGCSSYIFPKVMGNAKAGEMLFFNKKITAQQACERNLVTEVFPEDVFQKETEALVSYYGSLPPQSLKYSKTLNRDAERELLHKVNDAECELLVERWQSQECINAVMSFFAKK